MLLLLPCLVLLQLLLQQMLPASAAAKPLAWGAYGGQDVVQQLVLQQLIPG